MNCGLSLLAVLVELLFVLNSALALMDISNPLQQDLRTGPSVSCSRTLMGWCNSQTDTILEQWWKPLNESGHRFDESLSQYIDANDFSCDNAHQASCVVALGSG